MNNIQMKIFGNILPLVKSIGLPGLIEGKVPPLNKAYSLLQLAERNKMLLLFLESLTNLIKYPCLEVQLSRYRDKYRKTLDLITLASSLLEESGIHYTIFKTLKPFPYTPADIDILLWSSEDLARASQILKKKGFKPLGRDLYGLTMFSVDHSLNVDLTTQVAASSFIYLGKSALIEHSIEARIHGFKVQTLQPCADLVAVAAHCLYKEQMYTLSDYYTFVLSSQYYQQALQLAENTHTKFALETALKLTYGITVNAFGRDSNLVERLSNLLQTIDMSETIQTDKCFELPMKYPSHLLLRGLLEKVLEDSVARNSLPTALRSTLQPKSINKLLKHVKREGY